MDKSEVRRAALNYGRITSHHGPAVVVDTGDLAFTHIRCSEARHDFIVLVEDGFLDKGTNFNVSNTQNRVRAVTVEGKGTTFTLAQTPSDLRGPTFVYDKNTLDGDLVIPAAAVNTQPYLNALNSEAPTARNIVGISLLYGSPALRAQFNELKTGTRGAAVLDEACPDPAAAAIREHLSRCGVLETATQPKAAALVDYMKTVRF